MIAYIKGTLENISTDHIVIECGGIGYEILTYTSVLENLPSLHEEVKIITYMDVKEDDMRLFGFLTETEKSLFKQLISVSGVGPKGALSILNVLGPDNLVAAIISGDSKAISKANGIGAKTAQKVVLELRDRVSTEGTIFDNDSVNGNTDSALNNGSVNEAHNDAIEALVALGYSRSEALKAVKKTDAAKTEEIIKQALKFL